MRTIGLLVFFVALSFGLTTPVMANAVEHLVCQETHGGPAADVEVIIETQSNGTLNVQVVLTNANLPAGVIGTYTGVVGERGIIHATGTINGVTSSLRIQAVEAGQHIALYARGDQGERDIEFGFGLHSICN